MLDLLLTLSFAFLGGLVPALVWLWYWLRKDRLHPEPKQLIFKAFIFGMLMVPVAFVFQSGLNYTLFVNNEEILAQGGILAIILIVTWAGIEEILKFVAARESGLKNKANDERYSLFRLYHSLGI
jgi:RsiW-degrading membrane proteinase PrsW (M82 family)